MPRVLAALVLLSIVLGAQSSVLLVDNGLFLRKGAAAKCNQHELASTVSALSGLAPPSSVSPNAGATAQQLVQRNAFQRPRASVFMHLVGAGKESMMQNPKMVAAFENKNQRQVEVVPSQGSSLAATVIGAFQAVAAANDDVQVTNVSGI